jgi:hypothetical protein
MALLAGAGVGLWVLHAVRRAFDGPVLAGGSVGMHEAAVCALLALAAPLLITAIGRMRPVNPARQADLRRAAEATGWAALIGVAGALGLWWNPWWGVQAQGFGGWSALLTMLLAYPAVAALSLAPPSTL